MIGTRRRPEERRIQHVRMDKLTAHPLNEKLYGSARPDQKLIDSIRALGIIEPLIVTQRGQIISGHSRWQAAKIICAEDGVSEKTIYLMTMRPDHTPNDAWYEDEDHLKEEDDNPLLLEKFLIEANRQRVKTAEQKGREFKELKRIETELAKQRQKRSKGPKVKGKENFPDPPCPSGKTKFASVDEMREVSSGTFAPINCRQCGSLHFDKRQDHGQARDKAAEAIGMSGKTAEKLEQLVDAADAGDTNAADALKEINRKGGRGIDSAYREVAQQKSKKDPEAFAALEKQVAAARELQKLFGTSGEVARSKTPDCFHVHLHDLTSEQVKDIAARYGAA